MVLQPASTAEPSSDSNLWLYIPSEDIYMLSFSNCHCNSPTQLVKDMAKMTLENLKKIIKADCQQLFIQLKACLK